MAERVKFYETLAAKRAVDLEGKPRAPLAVTLPDGSVKEGTAWVTTPYDIAAGISQGLADSAIVAKIKYTEAVDTSELGLLKVEDGLDVEGSSAAGGEGGDAMLWDLTRPLLGSCALQLLKFDDPEAKAVFWHSSAHMLGQALEKKYGAHLTIGPPVHDGFYYDCYMGDHGVSPTEFKDLESLVGKSTKAKERFERLVVTKEEALELFKYNAFKASIISSKIPDGGCTTVYRNGDLIDLCRGPHVAHTGRVKAFAAIKNSGANWYFQGGRDGGRKVYVRMMKRRRILISTFAHFSLYNSSSPPLLPSLVQAGPDRERFAAACVRHIIPGQGAAEEMAGLPRAGQGEGSPAGGHSAGIVFLPYPKPGEWLLLDARCEDLP